MNTDKNLLPERNQQLSTISSTAAVMAEDTASKLFKSEERFSLAMRGADDGLWDWDLETNEVYYSPRWKNMLGYGEDELDHKLSTWEALVHPDDKDRVLEKIQDYISGRADAFEVEKRMIHKSGQQAEKAAKGL